MQTPRILRRIFQLGWSHSSFFQSLSKKIAKETNSRVATEDGWDNDNPSTNGEYAFLDRLIKHCRTVVDVGANAGEWSQRVLGLNANVSLFAFDPHPEAIKRLRERFRSHPNVKILPFALSDASAEVTLYDYGLTNGMSSLVSRENSAGVAPTQRLVCQTQRLDSLPEILGLPQIDFMKIDVEGWELNVLRGAAGLFDSKRISVVQFEYGGTWIDSRNFLADAFQFFRKQGFLVGKIQPGKVEWIETFHHRDLETFRYSNFIACSSAEVARRMEIL